MAPGGITPRLSDAELVTLATMQAILGYTSEAKWLRHARLGIDHLVSACRVISAKHRGESGSPVTTLAYGPSWSSSLASSLNPPLCAICGRALRAGEC